MGAGIPPPPRDIVTTYQLTHFRITESCNIYIMSHFYILHCDTLLESPRKVTACWTALAFRSSKEHISSAGDRLSTGQAIQISNVTIILSFI
jgi:hypothetical protein